MPLSGPSMLSLSLANICDGVAAGDLQAGDGVGHGADGLEQAPEGAEQAEEDQQADQVARELAPLVEAGGDAVEHRARDRRRQPEPVLALAQHGRQRRQQVERVGVERRRAFLAMLEAAQPLHLGPQRDDLAHDEEDADHQHAHDHAVQDRRVHEHAQQVLVQHVGEPRHGRQEQQHADEIGKRTAHAVRRGGRTARGRSRVGHQDFDALAVAREAADLDARLDAMVDQVAAHDQRARQRDLAAVGPGRRRRRRAARCDAASGRRCAWRSGRARLWWRGSGRPTGQ